MIGRPSASSVIWRSPFEEQMTIVRREEDAVRNAEEAAVCARRAVFPGIGSSETSTWKTRLKTASPTARGVFTTVCFAFMTARLA